MAIIMKGIPYPIYQCDYRDWNAYEYYEKYYINKEGKYNAKYHKRYFVGIPTMCRAMQILGAKHCERISILDGEGGNHLQASIAIFKKGGDYLGCAFLNSTGKIEIFINHKTKEFQTHNCNDFLKKCREIRDNLQLGKPE